MQFEENIFENKPQDPWKKMKKHLTPFRPDNCDLERLRENENSIEEERGKHFSTVIKYLLKKQYTIHPNTNPDHDIFGIDGRPQLKRIIMPKHIMTADPNEDITGKPLFIREDIPALYVITGFAHEATHLDRYDEVPEVKKVVGDMIDCHYMEQGFDITSDGKLIPDVMEEEAETDVQAFFLLVEDLKIEIEPENYCSYVGRGTNYQNLIHQRIMKRLGNKE